MITRKQVLTAILGMVLCLVFTGGVLAGDAAKININTAPVTELVKLKRIGPKYAERIVAFREKNGPFKTPEDLTRVPGIGKKTLEANKGMIVVT